MTALTRERVAVDGVDPLLDAIAQQAGEAPASEAARRTIGALVADTATTLDLTEARATATRAGRSVVLGEHAAGAVLAARWFEPGVPTSIHDHGTWGIAVVVDGDQLYERWRRVDGEDVALVEERILRAGDVSTWAPPPEDIHRQQGIRGGAFELIALGGPPRDGAAFRPAERLDRAAEALRRYDLDALGAEYHTDVVVDAHVPQWRFQLQGRHTVIDALASEIAHFENLRVARSRVTRGSGSRLVELEVHFDDHGQAHRYHEAHVLHGDEHGVVEHAIHCSGIWDPATIARHAVDAPMVWR